MKKALDDILKECIRQLETSGGDIEAALSKYPDRADELRPYLRVWASLSAVEKAQATPESIRWGRQQLLSGIGRADRQEGGAKIMPGTAGLSMRFAAVFVAGAALALGAVFLADNLDSDSGSPAQAQVLACFIQLDFNGDGQLNVLDVEAFRTAIQNQDPTFDLDGDGTVDIFDVVFAVQGVVTCLQQIQPPPLP